MSTRTVVIRNGAKLDYQLNYLVIRNCDSKRVFLDEIQTLLIESTAVSLTAVLISELTKRKVNVIFCDDKRNPIAELMSLRGSHDVSLKIKKQIHWSSEFKEQVWTEIVKEKIKKQAQHLERWQKKESLHLWDFFDEVTTGDKTNREGHAAKVYFNALFGNGFTRNDDNSINAALNYGYSILLSEFNREIVSNGYLTQLGLFHDNQFNPFNFSSDLMEPFRPIIDYAVMQLAPVKFEHEEKDFVLQSLQGTVLINGREEYISNAIKIYTRSILDALNDNELKKIRFYSDEL